MRVALLALCSVALFSMGNANSTAATTGCEHRNPKGVELLRNYSEKNGNSTDIFSVAAVGNQSFMLDEDYLPESPAELAAIITASPKYASAKRVLLVWPYSTMQGSFAPALAALLHKPVIGFAGPLWWYPDGVAISTDPQKNPGVLPDAFNANECLTAAGVYVTGSACKAIAKTHKPEAAIFGNAAFELSCEETKSIALAAQGGNAESNLRLYFYNYFVNVDYSTAIRYLSKAASLGDPTANYFVALSLKDNTTPAGKKLYQDAMKIAVSGGIEKAKAQRGLPGN